MAISIYKYPQVINLTVDSIMHNCERTGVKMIVSQHYTNSLVKLFRNTDQRVDLLLKDWDRRPLKFEEWEIITFKLFDGTREIMSKAANLVDFDRGQYVLEFTRAQTGALDLGEYQWCIIVHDTELDTTRMLWTNQDYGAQAPCKVLEGPLPQQAEAQSIDPVTLSALSQAFVSSALKGAAQMTNPSGVHSLVLVLANYTGVLTVEATLDLDIPASDDDWVTAASATYAGSTGTIHIPFTGNYNWVRLKFTSKTGINSISYRNA
jgi:hypothetical protein